MLLDIGIVSPPQVPTFIAGLIYLSMLLVYVLVLIYAIIKYKPKLYQFDENGLLAIV
ncbi:hypothetical protein [Acidianus sp. HS-5]|uniref:hypothetical protein n=1 Tax=Acidianus sp. HS-5 TaxID=2886040 RepID=UPI001F238B8C|nr:hypothetical protein [Acidianus sp. HS-5]BDC19828.1 hypothetical protein HS5_27180 [Acidianus sp. HS-5]